MVKSETFFLNDHKEKTTYINPCHRFAEDSFYFWIVHYVSLKNIKFLRISSHNIIVNDIISTGKEKNPTIK